MSQPHAVPAFLAIATQVLLMSWRRSCGSCSSSGNTGQDRRADGHSLRPSRRAGRSSSAHVDGGQSLRPIRQGAWARRAGDGRTSSPNGHDRCSLCAWHGRQARKHRARKVCGFRRIGKRSPDGSQRANSRHFGLGNRILWSEISCTPEAAVTHGMSLVPKSGTWER